MEEFKNHGDPALALAEECAEVIQVINKLYRFDGNWNEVPVGKDKTRWEQLCAEMGDLLYQWERLRYMMEGPSEADYWDGDESYKSLQ